MAKVNITKPTGSVENLTVLSAFLENGNTYIVFDSERVGSMGLPIIYVSKLVNDKLSKIIEDSEWEVVKGYLKGIINGTNFNYIKVNDSLSADEAFYRPLTLPPASFDIIKNKYVVNDGASSGASELVLEPTTLVSETLNSPESLGLSGVTNANSVPTPIGGLTSVGIEPTVASTPQVVPAPVNNVMPSSMAVPNLNMVSPNPQVKEPSAVLEPANVAPVMPSNNVQSNTEVVQVNQTPFNVQETSPVGPMPVNANTLNPVSTPSSAIQPSPIVDNKYNEDKETFMKACENMFDALLSKYQKELTNLEAREKELARKEAEIEQKLQNANEHLANAEARETVANIAHDNAQRVMDLNNLMPSNPNNLNNPTGVI